MGWLRDMRRLWRSMDDQGRRDLAAAIYERITVTSERIVEVELTQEAQRHGAALALPEWVLVARLEGSEHALPTIEVDGVAELLELLRAA
jgi:hypothetical protein